MSALKFKSISGAVLVAAVLLSITGLVSQAEARGGGFGGGGFGGGGFHGGGGFYHDDGFSGGSFRDGGGYAEGPRGAAVAVGPDGGVAARGPDGSAVAVGPDGAAVARGPDGGVAARGPYYGGGSYGGGWDDYYGSDGVAAGVAAGLAVGAAVASLPDDADQVVVDDQTYYTDNGVYYQPCYQGAAVNYCVVPAPN